MVNSNQELATKKPDRNLIDESQAGIQLRNFFQLEGEFAAVNRIRGVKRNRRNFVGCNPESTSSMMEEVSFSEDELAVIRTLSPLPPLAPDPTNRYADDPSAARFGQRLFYEPRLSADGSIACGSCHAFKRGFGDGGTLARGLGPLTRHSMALWNVAYGDWFFWDGRIDTLWGQALEPLEEPAEHGMTRLAVLHVLHDDPLLRSEYEKIFGELPELENKKRFPLSASPKAEMLKARLPGRA